MRQNHRRPSPQAPRKSHYLGATGRGWLSGSALSRQRNVQVNVFATDLRHYITNELIAAQS
eukprot:SAG11_NODE_28283_length_323_cov_1.008929_1_plen_60_part_01